MSDDLAGRFPANPAQAEYWNSTPVEQWVAYQAALDARFVAISEGLFARAAIRRGERVVDVGCGTGATTLEAAEQVGARGAVLAVDISEPLLTVARRRSAAHGHGHVRFLRADAQNHRFEPAAHDLLVSRFGVMFFSDPVAAFGNLRTALRPGGRLALVCWAALERNPWLALPLAAGVRRLGPPDPQPPRAPGPLAFSESGYVEEILAAAGFAEVTIDSATVRLHGAASAAEEADFACLLGPLARLLQGREPDPPTRALIIEEVTASFRPYESATGVLVPATVHYVQARRPA
jgi:SAM-dependent methyltransferase